MEIAAYYFPNYHRDERNEARHGKGWTEWELMKCARPRFPGHNQPKIPLWGYGDEADPLVMAKKIDAAANHGLDAFVFDWYWYDGPFLERALDEGFLKAPNRNRMKFALMWANHDWYYRHPVSRDTQACRIEFPWTTRPENLSPVWDLIIEKYMLRPEYWRMNGLPYFSIYAVSRFIEQMGGVSGAADAIALLRQKAEAAGLPGVHVNGMWYDVLDADSPGERRTGWSPELGFSSYTSYNLCYLLRDWKGVDLHAPYLETAEKFLEAEKYSIRNMSIPYYPVVTAGWDSSPRCIQSEMYDTAPGYPWLPVLEPDGKTFGTIVAGTLDLLKDRPADQRIMFINAWNEWTEGSYLEPDMKNGMGLLEALKNELARAQSGKIAVPGRRKAFRITDHKLKQGV